MNEVKFPLKLPMKEKQVKLIREGKKRLTPRNLDYDKYPYRIERKRLSCRIN